MLADTCINTAVSIRIILNVYEELNGAFIKQYLIDELFM